jgi:hypothetical protein
MSLPSFVHDVAWAFAEFVNEQSYKFAATGNAEYPLVAPEGGKEPLRAEYSAYTMGSDHDVYQDSSFGIPAIYLNDWPDRYIHTNFDTAMNIDSTKLKRAAFIGAASGYFLAGLKPGQTSGAERIAEARKALLMREVLLRSQPLAESELQRMNGMYTEYMDAADQSFDSYVSGRGATGAAQRAPVAAEGKDGEAIFKRRAGPQGPPAVFGYDYFAEHAKGAGVATPKLLSYQGLWGSGEEYAYEVLNFANGKRNAQGIRDAVSAEYGPVPVQILLEYLQALEKIGVVERLK